MMNIKLRYLMNDEKMMNAIRLVKLILNVIFSSIHQNILKIQAL